MYVFVSKFKKQANIPVDVVSISYIYSILCLRVLVVLPAVSIMFKP